METEDIVLRVEDLHTYFHTTRGTVRALNGVSFTVPRRKVLGVVGESGCGKSVTSLAVMQLVPPPGKIERGKITFQTARRGNGGWVDITALDRHSEEMEIQFVCKFRNIICWSRWKQLNF